MITSIHFIRPWFLLGFLLVLLQFITILRSKASSKSYQNLCDEHLLPYLIQKKSISKQVFAFGSLLLAALFMCIALAGPSWVKLKSPSYSTLEARVILLDLSADMLQTDLKPNRLTRAKFKLHDILKRKSPGQFGLIVYTGESFVVSPLTDDSQTIDSLIESLTVDLMPVSGLNLSNAENQAAELIKQAGFKKAKFLVLTGSQPDKQALETAAKLASQGIEISVMPLVFDAKISRLFQPLSTNGKGIFIDFFSADKGLEMWLTNSYSSTLKESSDSVVQWQDEGRWFLLPALIFLLPAFRRGWLQRIAI